MFVLETMENYSGHAFFLDKDVIQLIVAEKNRCAEQYKNLKGNIFTFQSPVQSFDLVTENEISVVLYCFFC